MGGRRGRRRPGPRRVRRPGEGAPDRARRHATSGCPGIHLSEPSPQRTPVLYQAGASNRGRAFAATHAEAVFLAVADHRRAARRPSPTSAPACAAAGRDPYDVKIVNGVSVVAAETDRAARAKSDEYRRYLDPRGHARAVVGLARQRPVALRPRRARRADGQRVPEVGRRGVRHGGLDAARLRRPQGLRRRDAGHRRLGRDRRRRARSAGWRRPTSTASTSPT